MKKLLPLWMLLLPLFSFSQVVYEDINNTGIYDFLDEMANLKVISLNAVVKPYSRHYIAEKLMEVRKYVSDFQGFRVTGKGKEIKQYKLTKRQEKELAFYLQDYQLDLPCERRNSRSEKVDAPIQDTLLKIPCPVTYEHKMAFLFKKKPEFAVPLNPLAFQYKDRLFTLSIRPVGGINYLVNENGNMYHRYWGAALFMYIGKNFGGYASLRDNYATELMSKPEYFTQATGGMYKVNEGGRQGGDWSEMRGGITASWKWGSLGLYKDFFTWGSNYHGANILSGHAPSFPYIQLHLKPVQWFEFNYIHGWLASKVVDSTRSYYTDDGTYRIVYYNKYIAANMFTFFPWRQLNISFGNSIIYSGDINPGFLIPFMFFKSIDHSSYFNNNAGSNAQMFIDISSRQIRHLNLYVTLFIDELKMSRILKKDEHNFTSWKAGFRLTDFPVPNLSFTGEYTMTRPGTYQHYISTTTYTSDFYNMGHYMRDNSQEIYLALGWKPIRGLWMNASYTLAEHGDDVIYRDVTGSDIVKTPFMESKTWQNYQLEVMARYELVNGIYLWIQYLNTNRKGDVRFGPVLLHGKTNSFTAGINIGF